MYNFSITDSLAHNKMNSKLSQVSPPNKASHITWCQKWKAKIHKQVFQGIASKEQEMYNMEMINRNCTIISTGS